MSERQLCLQNYISRRRFIAGTGAAIIGVFLMEACGSDKNNAPKKEAQYQLLWEIDHLTSVVVTGGGVLVTEPLRGLSKLDLKTGKEIWNKDVHGEITWYDKGRLYLLTGVDGSLVRVDPQTGEVIWEWEEGIQGPYDYDEGIFHSVHLLNNGTFFVEADLLHGSVNPFFLDAETGQFISYYKGIHINERINENSELQYVLPVGHLPQRRIGDVEFRTERYYVQTRDPRGMGPFSETFLYLDYWSISANKVISPTSIDSDYEPHIFCQYDYLRKCIEEIDG